MRIVKFWWSLIAPKNQNNYIDREYLTIIGKIRNDLEWSRIFIHGWWNTGHNFIKKYWLSSETYLLWRRLLQKLYKTIDTYINWLRLYPQELQFINTTSKWNFICGWDIIPDLTISSWDDQFPQLINQTKSILWYIFTDVDGVLDTQWNIISIINQDSINTIDFWKTPNDVTWGMKSKIEKLCHQIQHPCTIWIANGKNIDNMKSLLFTWEWIGTRVIIT